MWANLHYPDEDDITNFQRLSQLEEQTGDVHVPEIHIPMEGMYIWEWFMDLANSRQSGFGISPISYSELKAWSELSSTYLYTWEVSIIRRMDQCFIKVINEFSKRKTSSTKSKQLGETRRIM